MYGGMGGIGAGMAGMGMGMGLPQQNAFGASRGMGGMAGMGMGGMGGMNRGVGRSMGSDEGGQPSRREEFVQGKLFLGGLDNATTKDTLLDYCRQWYIARQLCRVNATVGLQGVTTKE